MIRNWLITGGAGAVVVILGASDASGKLVIDVRGPGGTKQMALQATDLGKAINLDVYAQVTGVLPSRPEMLSMVQGSLVSQGTTLGDIDPAGDLDANSTHTICAKDPFNGTGAATGKSQDIDGDGDRDLGGQPGAAMVDWVIFRTDYSHYGAEPGQGMPIPDGREFLIGTITFTPTQLYGDTWIRFLPKTDEMGVVTLDAGLWVEDSLAFPEREPGSIESSGFLLVVPEPAVLPLVGAATLLMGLRRKRS